MLRRLLLLLLLVAFAAPPAAAAMPACHEAAGGHAATAHHGLPAAPEKAPPPHACIGCAPIADWSGARILPRAVPATVDPEPMVTRLTLGGRIAPALPPPRRA